MQTRFSGISVALWLGISCSLSLSSIGQELFSDEFQQFAAGTDLSNTNYIPSPGDAATAVVTLVDTGPASLVATQFLAGGWALFDTSVPGGKNRYTAFFPAQTNQPLQVSWRQWIQSTNTGAGLFSLSLPNSNLSADLQPILELLDTGTIIALTNGTAPVNTTGSFRPLQVVTNTLLLDYPEHAFYYLTNGRMAAELPLDPSFANVVGSFCLSADESAAGALGNQFAIGDVKVELETFTPSSQFNYSVANGVVTINGYAGTNVNVSIPPFITGLPVASINTLAFASSNVVNVTIPVTVTNLGNSAFYMCDELLTVCIPGSVGVVQNLAFDYCESLQRVTMGDGVGSIGNSAFCVCSSLTNVTIPNSVTNIDDYAFENCGSLTNVTLSRQLRAVGKWAFGFTGLTGVTIPNSVTNFSDSVFYGTSLQNVTVPGNLSVVPLQCFASCYDLTNVTLGHGVTSIGNYAFDNCTSLASITIADTVTNIGDEAFYDCISLDSVFFQGNAPTVGTFVFYNDWYGVLDYDRFTTVYYLPGTTGWAAFKAKTYLSTVLWNPQAQTTSPNFGIHANQFGFPITGTTNIPIVVQACTDLANPNWLPIQTCTLTNGSLYFSDPVWTNYPQRFYRIVWP